MTYGLLKYLFTWTMRVRKWAELAKKEFNEPGKHQIFMGGLAEQESKRTV